MPCFTRVLIKIEDNEVNREARRKLGLPEEGGLTQVQAADVRIEAGIIKSRRVIRSKAPNAVIRREGNRLHVSVNT